HLAVALIGEPPRGLVQRDPMGARDFVAGLRRQIAQPARAIAQQIKRNHLEDARAVAPGANVNIFAVAEFAEHFRMKSGLLADLAHRGLLRSLAGIDVALGQCPNRASGAIALSGRFSLAATAAGRLDDGHPVFTAALP